MAVSHEVDREGESEWSDFADINADRNCDTFKKESVTNYGSGLFDECYKKIASCFPGNRKTPPKIENFEKHTDSSNLRVAGLHNSLFEKSNLDSIISILQRAAGTTGNPLQLCWRGSQMETQLVKSLHLKSSTQQKQNSGSNEAGINEHDGTVYTQEIFNFHGFTERGYTSLSPNSEVWTDGKEEMFFTSSEIQELRQTNHGKHLDHDMSAPFIASQSEQEQEWCDRSSTGSDEIFFVFGKPLINKRHSLFDECQAAAGLSALSSDELLNLKSEMADCVSEYSDVLVKELTMREDLLREKEIKNAFISSLLGLQSRIRNIRQSQAKKRISFGNSEPSGKYLTTVIPYNADEGSPAPAVLEKLVKIMDAMTEDSPSLPALLTDYILKVLCGT